MESQFLSFPFLFTFLVLLLTVLRLWKKSRKNSAPNLPPGPQKLPIVGSMHHLSGSSLPHVRLRDLAKEHGPIMHLQLGEVTNIVVSSPETAKAVMKTHDHIFAQRPFLLAANIMAYNSTDLAFAPYGDYWRQMRKICTQEMLSNKRVQSFGLIREEEVSKLITELSSRAGSTVNFSKMFNSVTYNIIQRVAIGKLWNGEEVVIPAIKKLIEAAGGFSLSDVYPSIKLLHKISTTRFKLQRAHKEADRVFQNIIDEHRARRASRAKSGAKNEEEDLIDVLLQAQSKEDLEHPITDDNIKAVILDVLSGGSDTIS
ncbi:cytochrome P450 71D9 [Jatropha curcas]|uniref:cytochrome P450 71D9 n=1 Tax=Jatropha curcas TaxID=180498 RepID=UPI001893CAEE|nr:cytochrome P450 71D9 [Jatropha curcas]